MNALTTMRRRRAFTLVELLVVLMIVGIVAGLAFALYDGQVRKIRRSDARQSLLGVAHELERCYTRWRHYNHADCHSARACYRVPSQSLIPLGHTVTAVSCDGHYRITSLDPAGSETLATDGESFSLFAIPQGAQARDDTCAILRYDSSGVRSARDTEGGQSTAQCW